jgi:5-formyltetrahydrofolate cyclo-ligase
MIPNPHSVAVLKRNLRIQALAARRAAHATLGETAGKRLSVAFFDGFPQRPGSVVAGYWPMGDEIDIRPLLEGLAAADCLAALPVVVGRNAPLAFRPWQPGAPLEPGAHGTYHPPAEAGKVIPDLILLPLLAFDRQGGRLGYGGGYYDRTLAALRARGQIQAVGVGYAAQELAALPHGRHDQRLDWILTEEGLREVRG